MSKVSIFVDVQNIYYTVRHKFGKKFNYNEFWSRVTFDREVVQAIAYATHRGDQKQVQFQNILRGIGFEVKLKPLINRVDGSAKGDWDVGIAIDILDYAPQSDLVVLASGDGDFDLLIEKIGISYNTPTEVYGIPDFTAKSLINVASQFYPIDETLLLE